VAQHFLMSAAARTLSLVDLCDLSEDAAHRMLCGMRWPDTDGAPICCALAVVTQALERDRAGALAEMRRSWQDGQLKLAVTATLLAHRRAHPRLFAEGRYQGLSADGPPAEHVCAYSREAGDDAVVVIAARFPAMLEADPGLRDVALPMPASLAGIEGWRDLLSGRVFEREIAVEAALSVLPAAVLMPRYPVTPAGS
jgi:(1->4)-alpha-D-glucan 1-alpha-D-glucosylmutase